MCSAEILGSTDRRGGLLALVGPRLPEVGHKKDAVCEPESRGEGFRTAQVGFDDLVAEPTMLARMAVQRAYLELAAVSQATHHSASLLSRCTDDGNHLVVGG